MVTNQREKLRRKYRPEPIKVLFIGESPPHQGTFFYSGDSFLYKYTCDAFEKAYGKVWHTHENFLAFFKESGCFLEDLSKEPINHLTKTAQQRAQRRRERRQGAKSLAVDLPHLQPRAIIGVMRGIRGNIRWALRGAGVGVGEQLYLPFPNWGRQRRFVHELCAALLLLQNMGILPEHS